MSTTIEDRVILLLRDKAGDISPTQNGVLEKLKSVFSIDNERKPLGGHGFWERLSEYTKINSKRWRKVYSREQRITSDMLEALSKLFPEYAFWLATGITDITNGHTAPDTAQTFPERFNYQSHATHMYFSKSIELLEKLYQEGKVNLDDDKERMYASERTRPLAHWWDSALCESAYKIAASEEYCQIKELWEIREEERKKHIQYITDPENRPWIVNKKNKSTDGVRENTILGVDPRTKHQDRWDIFYQPQSDARSKFALSVMNIPLANLTDAEIKEISEMPYSVIRDYLEFHNIDKQVVFPFKGGTIRMGNDGITEDEIERFRNVVLNIRNNQSDN